MTSSEPKSIRLNKSHRYDILTSVMDQWEKVNPCPTDGTLETLVRDVVKTYRKPKRNAPAEHKSLQQILDRTEYMRDLRLAMPEEHLTHFNLQTAHAFVLQTRDENNLSTGSISFSIPQELADELGIPYLSVVEVIDVQNEWPGYTRDGSFFNAIVMSNESRCNMIVVPMGMPAMKAYQRSQREVTKWGQAKNQMRNEVRDYLEQFNTTGQIREGWPEMEQYLPAHIADPAKVINLPTLTRSRLNERLGIQ